MKNKKNLKKWFYWFLLGISIIAVFKTLDNLADILNWINGFIKTIMPFILATLVAYLFYIPAKKLEKIFSKIKILKKKSRLISVILVYVIAIFLITILMKCVLPPITESIMELAKSLPNYYREATSMIEEADEESIISKIDLKSVIEKLEKIDISQFINFNNISQYISGVIGVANFIFSAFVTIIVSVYLLLERAKIKEFLRKLAEAIFPSDTYESVIKYVSKGNEILIRFIYCQILDGIIIGIITSIAMSIMNIKYAVLLGFIIGLFNIIPYFGAIIAVMIAVIITIFTGGIEQAIILGIVIIVLQQVDANIINPRILGEGLKVSPILVILAVTLGGAYFDILGMFLAVPIAAIAKIVLQDYIEVKIELKRKREEKQKNIKIQ